MGGSSSSSFTHSFQDHVLHGLEASGTFARQSWIRTNEMCANSCCAVIWPKRWTQAAEDSDVIYLPVGATMDPAAGNSSSNASSAAYPPPQPYFSKPHDRALYAIDDDETSESTSPRSSHHHSQQISAHNPYHASVPHYSYRDYPPLEIEANLQRAQQHQQPPSHANSHSSSHHSNHSQNHHGHHSQQHKKPRPVKPVTSDLPPTRSKSKHTGATAAGSSSTSSASTPSPSSSPSVDSPPRNSNATAAMNINAFFASPQPVATVSISATHASAFSTVPPTPSPPHIPGIPHSIPNLKDRVHREDIISSDEELDEDGILVASPKPDRKQQAPEFAHAFSSLRK